MSVLPKDPEQKVALADDERWTLVQRIVASQCFIKAPQLRDILIYLTRRVLEDNPSGISEHEVGCNVLGRRPDFNPNEDNIVRVQVRHLRKKLEDFFAAEGQDESILLSIPKGAYIPRFEPRPARPAASEPGEDSGGTEAIRRYFAGFPTAVGSAKKTPAWLWGSLAGLAVLVIVLATAALLFWREKEALLAQLPASGARLAPADDVLWAKFFDPGQQSNLVVADTCLVMLQDILNIDLPLRELVANNRTTQLIDRIQDTRLRAALTLIEKRQYTSLGDLNVVARVLELGRRYNAKPRIRYARYLDTREFMTGNFMLIGSHRGDPWIQLFEPQLNFQLERDERTNSYHFLNRSPKPGEQVYYGPPAAGSNVEQSYADIAILPNLSGTGHILVVSGITMEATEAAGDLVASNEFSVALAKMLRERPGGLSTPYAEVFLQTKTMPGAARVSKIISHRLLTPQKTEQQ